MNLFSDVGMKTSLDRIHREWLHAEPPESYSLPDLQRMRDVLMAHGNHPFSTQLGCDQAIVDLALSRTPGSGWIELYGRGDI